MGVYSNMPQECFDFINKRKLKGYKNTYHSLQAVFQSNSKKSDTLDFETIKKEYVIKYNILQEDMPVFDLLYHFAIEGYQKSLKRQERKECRKNEKTLPKTPKTKYYAIKIQDGVILDKIVTSWDECFPIVNKHSAVYKSFKTLEEANSYLSSMADEEARKKADFMASFAKKQKY